MSEPNTYGKLYLCGTPIGNLEDITFRAIRILKEVDFIACEDTRHTIKLLNHFEIKTKMISYHQHNEEKSSEYIVKNLLEGKNIALVSDAGMPIISDPGSLVVKKSIENNITLVPVPGPSAFLMSLVVSGFDTTSFSYYGFLPHKNKDQNEIWEKMKFTQNVSVIYESPHRLLNTLNDIKNNLGEVTLCICREITKKYEEFFRGDIDKCINYFSTNTIKGEFCIVIDKISNNIINDTNSIELEINKLILEKVSTKDISKIISKKFNIPSKEIYQKIVDKNKI